jgi:hypothetical protein
MSPAAGGRAVPLAQIAAHKRKPTHGLRVVRQAEDGGVGRGCQSLDESMNGAITMPRRALVSSIRHEPGGEKAIVAVWVPCIATGN